MLGKCWRFWDFPMSLWQHPQDFPDFPQANHPSPWDSGHVEAHGWRDPRSPIWWPSCWSSSPEGERSILGGPGRSTLRICSVLDFLEINSVGFAVKGVRVVGLSPSCWIFRSFSAFPLQRPKKSKLLGLRVDGVAGVAGRNPSKSRNPWGPYSNCRRKDGTARGVESGSALRGPFRDFGFAWHGFVDLFLLAL